MFESIFFESSFQRWFICHRSQGQGNSLQANRTLCKIFIQFLQVLSAGWLLKIRWHHNTFCQGLHFKCRLFHVSLQNPVEGHILQRCIFIWNAMRKKKNEVQCLIESALLLYFPPDSCKDRQWQCKKFALMQHFQPICHLPSDISRVPRDNRNNL